MLISAQVLDQTCDISARVKVVHGQSHDVAERVIARRVPIGVRTTSSESELLTRLLGYNLAADLSFVMGAKPLVRKGFRIRLTSGRAYSVSRVDHYPTRDRCEYQVGVLAEEPQDAD